MKPAEKIKRLFNKSTITVGSEVDNRILSDAMNALKTAPYRKPAQEKPTIWRIIMNSKITKLTTAAVIIIAVLIGINHFGGSIDGASVAFAEVLEYIQAFNYTFDLTVGTGEQAVQAMVLEPGRMRIDATVGLGKISSVIDTVEGKSMLLFHQFKTAQIHEMPSWVRDYNAEGILFLCTKSIENLWDMRDGTEEQLGEKEIEGQTAVGFKVLQKGQYMRCETTIWAQVEMAFPILVEMIMTPLDASSEQMKFTMNNFDLDVELDEELFSLEVPAGYTLAYQTDLDDLEVETVPSAESEKIEQMLELWSQGKKDEAVEALLKVDFTEEIEFGTQPYLFSMTEKGYVSLKPADQKQVIEGVMAMASTLRKIGNEVLILGQTAVSSNDYEKAEQYFQASLQLGKLLTRNPDSMLIAYLVGIAIEQKTLNEMVSLYTTTNNRSKLQTAKKRLRMLEAEKQRIKNQAAGR